MESVFVRLDQPSGEDTVSITAAESIIKDVPLHQPHKTSQHGVPMIRSEVRVKIEPPDDYNDTPSVTVDMSVKEETDGLMIFQLPLPELPCTSASHDQLSCCSLIGVRPCSVRMLRMVNEDLLLKAGNIKLESGSDQEDNTSQTRARGCESKQNQHISTLEAVISGTEKLPHITENAPLTSLTSCTGMVAKKSSSAEFQGGSSGSTFVSDIAVKKEKVQCVCGEDPIDSNKPDETTVLGQDVSKSKSSVPISEGQSSSVEDSNLLRCLICYKKVANSEELKKHLVSHAKREKRHCKRCDSTFSTSENWVSHMLKHNRIQLKCEVCADVFYGENSYKEHIQSHAQKHSGTLSHAKKTVKNNATTHQGIPLLKCSLCERTFSSEVYLKAHRKVHSSVNAASCPTCGKSYASKTNLMWHQRIHNDERKYKCEICGKAFVQNGPLRIHLRGHTGERPFHCQTCGKTFSCKRNLVTHVNTHTKLLQYSCTKCKKLFNSKIELVRHEKVHSNDKAFSCDICKKSFGWRESLVRHMNKHSDSRPFICNICGCKFGLQSSLYAHTKIHRNLRPFECDICGKRFNVKQNLKMHLCTHAESRPYVCTVCGHRCKVKLNLKQHILTHSNGKGKRGKIYTCTSCSRAFTKLEMWKKHTRVHRS